MAGRLFKRGASLQLTKVTGETATRFFPAVSVSDTTTVTDLRVAFRVEKTLRREPNTTEVTVWNLKEASRALLQSKPLIVRLDVGYDGLLERLFQGDMIWSESRHEGVDWASRILIGDGDRAVRHARVNRSYRGGVTVRDALKQAADAMGLTIPPDVLSKSALGGQFVAGVTLQGRAAIELSRLLDPLGLDWSIQDGRLQILDKRTPRAGDVISISQDSGLIGSPELGAPERRKGKPTLTVQVLLNPKIIPGGKIRIEARSINGDFRAERVTHEGDTHGEQWLTTVEAKPL